MAHEALSYLLLQLDIKFFPLLTTFQLHSFSLFLRHSKLVSRWYRTFILTPDFPMPASSSPFRSLVKCHFRETSHHPIYGGHPCSIYLLNLLPVSPY